MPGKSEELLTPMAIGDFGDATSSPRSGSSSRRKSSSTMSPVQSLRDIGLESSFSSSTGGDTSVASPSPIKSRGHKGRSPSSDRKSFKKRSPVQFGKNAYEYDPNTAAVKNIFDTHCHLDRVFYELKKASRGKFFQEDKVAPAVGIMDQLKSLFPKDFGSKFEGCITVICDPRDWKKSQWEWLTNDVEIWLAFGCHPQFVKYYDEVAELYLLEALKHPRTVSLGEIGLDDKWAASQASSKKDQQLVFKRQLQLALRTNKALCLHIRGPDATKQAEEVMKQVEVPREWPIHMHCFSDNWDLCEKWIQDWPGMKFGLTPDYFLEEVGRKLPLDKLLLETDAPYFPPKGLRDRKTAVPGHVWHSGAQVALLKKTSVDTVLAANRTNVQTVYGIMPPDCLLSVEESNDDKDTIDKFIGRHVNTCTATLSIGGDDSSSDDEDLGLHIHTCTGSIRVMRATLAKTLS